MKNDVIVFLFKRLEPNLSSVFLEKLGARVLIVTTVGKVKQPRIYTIGNSTTPLKNHNERFREIEYKL